MPHIETTSVEHFELPDGSVIEGYYVCSHDGLRYPYGRCSTGVWACDADGWALWPNEGARSAAWEAFERTEITDENRPFKHLSIAVTLLLICMFFVICVANDVVQLTLLNILFIFGVFSTSLLFFCIRFLDSLPATNAPTK